jgi:4-amino-4-deoxy-L-arabinose transferase-like glycosyltransferase
MICLPTRPLGATDLATAEKAKNTNGASDLSITLGLLLLWVIAISLANPGGDFPLNDDWVYGLVVRNILKTGQFQFISPASSNVLTQAYWGALFCIPTGFSFIALRLSTLVIAGLGVVSLYGVIREVGRSKTTAALASLLLIFNPMYFGLSHTFMTDVPFTATLIICFYFYTIALKRGNVIHLLLALFFALAALGIRQYGLLFIGTFSAGYIVKKGLHWRPISEALAATGLGITLQWTYQRWLETSGQFNPSTDSVLQTYKQGVFTVLQPERLYLLLIILVYLGLFTLPSLMVYQKIFFNKQRSAGNPYFEIFATIAAVYTAVRILPNQLPRLGNILTYAGLGPFTLRDTYLLGLNNPDQNRLNIIMWSFFTICGSVGFIFLLVLFAQAISTIAKTFKQSWISSKNFSKPTALISSDNVNFPQNEAWLLTALLTSIFGYIAVLTLGQPFDRYLVPLYPLILILTSLFIGKESDFDQIGRHGKVLVLFLISIFAYFSVASTHDYLAWNRARWQALNELTSVQKISPKLIDGGYEFNGWLLADRQYKQKPDKSYWWVNEDNYVITSGPLKGYEEIARYPFQRWLMIQEKPILTLKKTKQK